MTNEQAAAIVASIIANISGSLPLLIPILYTLLAAMVIDTLSGMWAAAQSNTFSWQYVGEFLRGHVMQRIVPIMLGMLSGVALGGVDNPAGLGLIGIAGAAAAVYLRETIASVADNLKNGKIVGNTPRGITALSAPIVSDAVATPPVATPPVDVDRAGRPLP